MMEWRPNLVTIRELIEVIDDAFKRPSPEVNQKMIDSINMINSQADGVLYLLEIFLMTDIDVVIRNSAGYLIKNRILMDASHERNLPDSVKFPQSPDIHPIDEISLNKIAESVIDGLNNAEEMIRNISGSILSALLLTWPASIFEGVLSQIHANCSSDDKSAAHIQNASWSAALKIIEDVLDHCTRTFSSADSTFQQFTSAMFLTANQICTNIVTDALEPNQCETIALALRSCNKIACHCEYLDENLLDSNAEAYLTSIGTCSSILDESVQVEVIKGVATLLEYHPKSVLQGVNYKAISLYMTSATSHASYTVRFEACIVWPKIVKYGDEVVKSFIGDNISALCANLLKDFKYADRDYCQMNPSQFAADDASMPDDLTRIAPQHHYEKSRGGGEGGVAEESSDDEDEDGPGGNTWGSDWSLRKGAALTIDNLSQTYKDVQFHFRLIERYSFGLSCANSKYFFCSVLTEYSTLCSPCHRRDASVRSMGSR
eukprot:GHVH01001131.1.p2 GENE.GHVH01001131.1~~GHVH01001131.1.p2  ORF type:complete len:489 (+),score=85.13 GHVH01001131.1:176-1642(+)